LVSLLKLVHLSFQLMSVHFCVGRLFIELASVCIKTHSRILLLSTLSVETNAVVGRCVESASECL
jgi:hypothetical protein